MRMSASRRACVSDLYDSKRRAPGMGVFSWKQKLERLSMCKNLRRDACVDVVCGTEAQGGGGQEGWQTVLFPQFVELLVHGVGATVLQRGGEWV